jgi:hypothetical protein
VLSFHSFGWRQSGAGSDGSAPRSRSVAHSFPFRKDDYALKLLPGRAGEALSARLATGFTGRSTLSRTSPSTTAGFFREIASYWSRRVTQGVF